MKLQQKSNENHMKIIPVVRILRNLSITSDLDLSSLIVICKCIVRICCEIILEEDLPSLIVKIQLTEVNAFVHGAHCTLA